MDEALKPCPFCGGEADYHSEKGPTGEVYGWVGCNQCDAMSCHTDTRSMQPEETHPIDAWNTRADAAPTPNAEVVEDVARAICKARYGHTGDYIAHFDSYDREAQAAIAALDAARGDPVARLIAHMKTIEPDALRHGPTSFRYSKASQRRGSRSMVEVTQEDREAAADIWRDYVARVGEVMAEKAMRAGALDEGLPNVFARHRIAAENAALERAATAVHIEWFVGNRHRYASELGPACEAAIRAMKGPSNA